MSPPESGCDLFVDAVDQDAVLAVLSAHLGTPATYSHLNPPGFLVRVGRNRLAEGRNRRSDDFLDWPTLVEVSAEPDRDLAAFVAAVVAALRAAGHRVITIE